MVLQPIGYAGAGRPGGIPAWEATEPRQLAEAPEYLLVTQPDHAALAGELAAALAAEWMPRLSPAAIAAIAAHDEGWRPFDTRPSFRPGARPASFIEIPSPDFLAAWNASIEHAATLSPLAGAMVSRHFCRLLRGKPEDSAFDRFLAGEAERRAALERGITEPEIEALVDVLQFCDLLSLYLCCGATERTHFPQSFAGRTLEVMRSGEGYQVSPWPFRERLRLEIPARRWPGLEAQAMFASIEE
ncbi:MAG: DUF3891 family protein [Acidobacteria bacterium]|nr:DUF3891 family protein [Acidobacteriota bacterium]